LSTQVLSFAKLSPATLVSASATPPSSALGFAKSSTWVLSFAKPSLTALVSTSATPPLPSLLPN